MFDFFSPWHHPSSLKSPASSSRVLRIGCAVVMERSVFSVKIYEGKIVDELKKNIKALKANLVQCDADDLALLLAKKKVRTTAALCHQHGRYAWLQGSDSDLESLLMETIKRSFEST